MYLSNRVNHAHKFTTPRAMIKPPTMAMPRSRSRPHAAAAAAALALVAILVISFAPTALTVNRDEFKTCAQSGFCRRHRAHASLRVAHPDPASGPTWSIDPKSVDASQLSLGIWSARLISSASAADSPRLALTVSTLKSGAIRVQVADRQDPRVKEGKVVDVAGYALSHEPGRVEYKHEAAGSGSKDSVQLKVGDSKVDIKFSPFTIAVTGKDQPEAVVLNARNFFRFETGAPTSAPPTSSATTTTSDSAEVSPSPSSLSVADQWLAIDHDAAGSETWKSHTDAKPYGARSFGFDLQFAQTSHVYGLAEHASDFNLPSTRGEGARYTEPYRLYNLDVFEFELDSPMALYGSVPYLVTQGTHGSAGALVLSASEMWIDIERHADSLAAHWMTESSPLDLVLFTGPTLADVHTQYMHLAGYPTLPPLFATAYHQCRWNYNDEKDVKDVDAGFDEHDIPYDVLWLDIEHTDGKRYFTWDAAKFPTPQKMLDGVASKGRKMVTIVDPHIKVDSAYHVSSEASSKGLFVKRENEGEGAFNGHCWPGDSNWVDFLDKKAREWWAGLFKVDKYKGSTLDLFTWNDMNEPSVFGGPETTMPKTAKHVGGVEHRDVHNLYGMQQHRSTHLGHLQRTLSSASTPLSAIHRPFVLSRAFFTGTQRYGAIWTGDNDARWDHLASSTPMLLSLGVSGITFAGADVGGFFRNPDAELLARWYAAGAMQPFFRAHAHIDTKRREPWVYEEGKVKDAIRAAVRRRYRWLPYVYSTFFDAWSAGKPVVRPLVMEFGATDKRTWGVQEEYMLGDAVLCKAVTRPGATSEQVYLPSSGGAGAGWYDVGSPGEPWTYVPKGGKNVSVDVTALDTLPMFVKAGSVVVARERIRRSSAAGITDPLTVYIALDANGEAAGHVVVDDGKSFGVLGGAVVDVRMKMANGKFGAKLGLPKVSQYDSDKAVDGEWVSQKREINVDAKVRGEFLDKFGGVRVERLVIVATDDKAWSKVKRVQSGASATDSKERSWTVEKQGRMLVVKEPGFALRDSAWVLTIE
ncbi:glycosyl hydrolases family 31-domain-containing protein [Catenaria anguillulae PL171]|uniref:Glucosidase II subunit alpha n=1 Tax=Catenaria anguillulae PL171 TaxID=765915 RepID=A0A1Y2HFE7_9FUNG|nr:glycosyl hydrolases family 31-domain-containing protein [Catenaria anguillulae PL171]